MSDPVEADPGLMRSDWVTLDTETSLKPAHQICGEGDVAVGNLLDLKSSNDVVVLGRPSDHRRSDQRRAGDPGEEQEGGSSGLAIRPWRPRSLNVAPT